MKAAGTKSPTRSAAITGAGSGLGREIAIGFSAKGYNVFGTALSTDEIVDVERATDGKAKLTCCDITDEDSVKSWSHQVSNTLGEGGLDVLISNAGILTPGPIETLPLSKLRREFEVNVFGAVSVINCYLPALRKARGRIVQISTMTALLPLPFNGPSGASKAAFEAFADVYRAELMPFGIDVVIAEAGNMKTGGPARTAETLRRTAVSMTAEQRHLYGNEFDCFAVSLNDMQASGMEAHDAAARVIQLAEQVPAQIRAAIGPDAARVMLLVRERSAAELDTLRRGLAGLSY